MSSFVSVSRSWGGILIQLLSLLLLFAQLYVCVGAIRHHRHRLYAVGCCVYAVAQLFVLTCIFDSTYLGNYADRIVYPPLILAFRTCPWMYVLLCLVLFGIGTALFAVSNAFYIRHSVSPNAIKDALDMLPVGVCISDAKGTVVLSNLYMNTLVHRLFATSLTDGPELWSRISRLGVREQDSYLVHDGDAVYLFAISDLSRQDGYTQIIAHDVTTQYRVTAELQAKNAKLREVQLRIKAYDFEESSLVMSKELLAARVAVHDELGHILMCGKSYFDHPETRDDEALLALLRRGNRQMMYEVEQLSQYAHVQFDEALRLIQAIGVRLQCLGEIPAYATVRSIAALALREVAVNTVKHADGDQLTLVVQSDEHHTALIFTNNGTPPDDVIVESGGLLSLRRMVEASDGTMVVQSLPVFSLTLVIPNRN